MIEVSVKEGVSLEGLQNIMFRALLVCAEVFSRKKYGFVVTSTLDGKHMPGSYHYEGHAFDVRTRRIPKTFIPDLADRLRQELKKISRRFQVVVHDTHIHVEYDRREKNETSKYEAEKV